jgi:arsenite methyltransferase
MDIKQSVRETYGQIAKQSSSCCVGPVVPVGAEELGYASADLAAVPEGANLGLGCGNPLAIAGLQPGETVLDLGSGAGFDCFLAANAVGLEGRVIGVDMTPEMIEKARGNAAKGGYANVEFRLGEIEALPVADASVDVIISNCVINLVPDKAKAFAEAFRVLRPGGRLHVSDIVLGGNLPAGLLESVAAYVGCVSGAIGREAYLQAIAEAGFQGVTVNSERDATELLSGCCASEGDGGCGCSSDGALPEGAVLSVNVTAHRPV